jgi:hypothetical protein
MVIQAVSARNFKLQIAEFCPMSIGRSRQIPVRLNLCGMLASDIVLSGQAGDCAGAFLAGAFLAGSIISQAFITQARPGERPQRSRCDFGNPAVIGKAVQTRLLTGDFSAPANRLIS